MTMDDLEWKIEVFMDFSAILSRSTHFKSIHARWWQHLAYVNTSYPMSVAGSMSLDLFAVGLQTCTAVARSPSCISWALLVEIQRLIGWKSEIFLISRLIYCPHWGRPPLNLWKSFTDPETRVIQAANGENLVILDCTVFEWSTHVTDRQTDGQTELLWLRRTTGVAAVVRKNVQF